MRVENGELVQVTEFRRDMPTLIEELKDGRREKVVVTRHGAFEAVLVSVPKYEEAVDAR